MKEYFVDTNFILRYLLNDIPSQVDIIQSYFLKAKKGEIKIAVPFLVFVELDFALSRWYKFDKWKIIDTLFELTKLPYLNIEKYSVLLESLLLYSKNSVSFVDALFLTEAKQSGKQLLTFDKRLKKISSKISS